MSFYTLSNGQKASGVAEAAFLTEFSLIPSGTTAPAMIKKFVLDDSINPPVFSLQWQILEGDFAKRVVFQKIKCFDEKPESADRAKEMLCLIFRLLNFTPTHDNIPNDSDLAPLQGKMLGIKIKVWGFQGKTGNNVSEVYPLDDNFQTVTGKTPLPKTAVDSAFSRQSVPFKDDLLDDLTF